MKVRSALKWWAALGLFFLAGPGLALAGNLRALSAIERGRWEVRDLDSGAKRPALCLGDTARLLQIAHGGAACPSEVIDDGPGAATVQYSCSGRGFGHTHVRTETPRLLRIDTQGLNNGRPFSHRFELKRVGSC